MQVPDLSRRQIIALMAVVAGIVAITLALLSGTDSDGAAGPDRAGSIDPVAPIDPDDKSARDLDDGTDPLDDVGNPFASSFGDKSPRQVTVRVSASGPVGVGVRYRGGHKTSRAVMSGSYSVTRTVKGGSPLAFVGIRLGPKTNRGTCTILVDGVKVSSHSVNEAFGITTCLG